MNAQQSRLHGSDEFVASERLVEKEVFLVKEHGSVAIPLSFVERDGVLEINEALNGAGFFNWSISKNELIFKAQRYVGLVPINSRVLVQVQPRVPVGNLIHLMNQAEDPPAVLDIYRYYDEGQLPAPPLVQTLSLAFLQMLEPIEQYGLYKSYTNQSNDTSFPSGRLNLAQSIQRHYAKGDRLRVNVSRFEHSCDNSVNRCIKYTIWLLFNNLTHMRKSGGVLKILKELSRFYGRFNPVKLDLRQGFLRDINKEMIETLPENREYYRNALLLSLNLLNCRSINIESASGDIAVSTLLVDMESLFESYTRKILQRSVELRAAGYLALDGNISGDLGAKQLLFSPDPTYESAFKKYGPGRYATPDVVIARGALGHKEHAVVMDMKYKDREQLDRDDINQIVAYSVLYQCKKAMIVSPSLKTSRPGYSPIGVLGDIELGSYKFDLSSLIIQDEEDKFTRSVLNLATRNEQ